METEQRINWNLADTRRAFVFAGIFLFSGLAASCNKEYHLNDEVRNDPNDPNQRTGQFFITLYNGLADLKIGRYRLDIAPGALSKEIVSHTLSISTVPLLDLITVVLLPTGNVHALRTVRFIAELGVIRNSLPWDRRIHTLYNVDPKAEHTLEAYWANWQFTRLTWNGGLLKKPEPTPIDKSLAYATFA